MQQAHTNDEGDDRPLLLFFSLRRSGPARRMASLVAWFGVTEKKRLRVVEVDAEDHEDLARALDVTVVPTLVLVRGRRVLDRREGRTTGRELEEMLARHIDRRPGKARHGGLPGDRTGRAA